MAKRDDERLAKLDNMFRSAVDHPTWIDWRAHAQKCFEYRDNDQWTDDELRILAERNQPPTVNNQVKVTVDRMVGRFVISKTRIAYRGREPQDEPGANALDQVYRYVHQNNKLEFEERDMFEDGATGGFGAMYAHVTFDELLQPEIRLQTVDPFEIFVDPWSRRYDWNEDARFIAWARWFSFDEAKELYPQHAKKLSAMQDFGPEAIINTDAFEGKNYIDHDEDGNPTRIRVVEIWYRERERHQYVITEDQNGKPMQLRTDGMTATQKKQMVAAGGKVLTKIGSNMRVGVFSAGILFDDQDSPHDSPLFPFIPYFVHRRKNGEPYSPIWTALPMQEAINKRESKSLHLLNSNQLFFQQGAITDKEATAEEMAKSDGMVEVHGPLDRIKVEKNTELAQTQFSMHLAAQADFKRITGINEESLGQPSNVRSGIGIARKQQAADLILSPIFDNFRRTREIQARLIYDLVAAYFNEQKLMLISDDLGQSAQFILDDNALASIKGGKYDVVVDEIPDVTTLQQEQQALIAETLPAVIQAGPAWGRILIELSDLKNKEALLKRVDELTPEPKPEPTVSMQVSWSDLTSEEKVAWAGKLGMEALGEAQREAPKDPDARIRSETELSREIIRATSAGQTTQMKIDSAEKIAAMKPRGTA